MAVNLRDVFPKDGYVDAVVSYVEGPRKFFVQPVVFCQELRSLAKRLQVMYCTSLLGEGDYTLTLDNILMNLKTGSPCWCAAPFGTGVPEGSPTPYYRALVLARSGPSRVTVFFVDYGNACSIPIGELKVLPPSYQQMPCMAVPCRLVEGEQGGVNVIDPKQLISIIDGFHVVVHVANEQEITFDQKLPNVADPLWVSLYVTDGKDEANVGEMLAETAASNTAAGN